VFRKDIFSLEQDMLEQQHAHVDQQIQFFLQFPIRRMIFINFSPFVKTQKLDNGVQLDSHQFLTLVLSLFEGCLSYSKVFNLK